MCRTRSTCPGLSDVLDAASRQVLRVSPTDASRAEYATYAEDNYDQLDPGFTVGGPLARDRVWMFAGYVPSLRDTVRSVIFRDGSSGPYRQQLVRHHATANINTQFGPRWRARGTFNSGSQRQERLLPPTGWQRQPEREFRDRRCHGKLFDFARRRRHPEYAVVFRHESGIFLSESLQRGRLSRRPISVSDTIAQSARCPSRTSARACTRTCRRITDEREAKDPDSPRSLTARCTPRDWAGTN